MARCWDGGRRIPMPPRVLHWIRTFSGRNGNAGHASVLWFAKVYYRTWNAALSVRFATRRTFDGADCEEWGATYSIVLQHVYCWLIQEDCRRRSNETTWIWISWFRKWKEKENAKVNAQTHPRGRRIYHDQAFRSVPRCSRRFPNHENDSLFFFKFCAIRNPIMGQHYRRYHDDNETVVQGSQGLRYSKYTPGIIQLLQQLLEKVCCQWFSSTSHIIPHAKRMCSTLVLIIAFVADLIHDNFLCDKTKVSWRRST